MTNESIDAVAMTRRIRDRMYEETKDLGADEILRYVRERSRRAARRVEERGRRIETPPAGVGSR